MVQVKISAGTLEGKTVQDELVTYCSFQGIPYAAPPVGELRFQPPQPVKPWEGVRSAKEVGSACYQFDALTRQVTGSEDCLFLNVYTPNLNPNKPLPVMVWIHGGAFMSGSGNDDIFGPEFLVKKDVILVTFNYRLEVLGFLCLDTEDVPGNAGMKDQVAALKWVQENISKFGGDPNNVTLFGESAGGASVCGHLLSPMSKGLFQRAIAQSGATTDWWSHPPEPRNIALTLAKKLGFFSEDEKEIFQFFKDLPAEKLINVSESYTLYEHSRGLNDLKFGMTIEKYYGQERFLVGEPYDLLRNGVHKGVDVIIGYNEDEGFFTAALAKNAEELLDRVENFDEVLVPTPINLTTIKNVRIEAGRKFKKFYFGKPLSSPEEKFSQMFRYYTFDMFAYGIHQWAKISSKAGGNKTYLYKFTCKSTRNVMGNIFGSQKYAGGKTLVCHGDDLLYLFPFKMSGAKVEQNSEEFRLIEQVTKLWTNFAKFGNPTPDNGLGAIWPPYDVEKQQYLEIGNQLKVDSSPDAEDIKVWEDIFREYYPTYVH